MSSNHAMLNGLVRTIPGAEEAHRVNQGKVINYQYIISEKPPNKIVRKWLATQIECINEIDNTV
jgi:hypothetical protein